MSLFRLCRSTFRSADAVLCGGEFTLQPQHMLLCLLRRDFHRTHLSLQAEQCRVEARNLDVCASRIGHRLRCVCRRAFHDALGDVVGPSAPRTHVFACPVAASRSFAVCASMRALPPAVSPLGRAPCSVALPSLAGWSPRSRSARDRRLPGEVRACQTVRQSDEYSACSRCYSRHTIGGKQELTKAERTMNQGASTLLSYPMYCAPRHVRVLRSPRTMSSHHT